MMPLHFVTFAHAKQVKQHRAPRGEKKSFQKNIDRKMSFLRFRSGFWKKEITISVTSDVCSLYKVWLFIWPRTRLFFGRDVHQLRFGCFRRYSYIFDLLFFLSRPTNYCSLFYIGGNLFIFFDAELQIVAGNIYVHIPGLNRKISKEKPRLFFIKTLCATWTKLSLP